MNKTSTQISFTFEPHKQYLAQDFMISDCNHAAYKAVCMWPQWPFFAMSVFGPKGCGKTHLAHIFTQHVCLRSKQLFSIPIIPAATVKTDKISQLHAQNHCLVVEDVSENADEEALFHLFNIYQNEGGFILFTSEKPFHLIHFKLPDLISRLKIVPSVPILKPDDKMLEALLIKLFTDRQITVSADVINYMLQNMERSFSYAERLVAQADSLSLALKRAVTVPIIKDAMRELAHNPQQDLFD